MSEKSYPTGGIYTGNFSGAADAATEGASFHPAAIGGHDFGYGSGRGHFPGVGVSPPFGSGQSLPCPGGHDCGGKVFHQTLHGPEQPPEHVVCRRRLPTPPPNVHEQTIVIKPRRRIIHEIIERPICPPPIVRTKYVMAPPDPPHYSRSTVSVCPQGSNMGGGYYPGLSHGGGGYQPNPLNFGINNFGGPSPMNSAFPRFGPSGMHRSPKHHDGFGGNSSSDSS